MNSLKGLYESEFPCYILEVHMHGFEVFDLGGPMSPQPSSAGPWESGSRERALGRLVRGRSVLPHSGGGDHMQSGSARRRGTAVRRWRCVCGAPGSGAVTGTSFPTTESPGGCAFATSSL